MKRCHAGALALIAVVALGVPSAATAHATLVRSIPADRAVLATAPRQASYVFNDGVSIRSGIKAVRNGGGSVLGGKPRIEAGRVLVVPLRAGLGDGDYTVLWRVLTDDGHTISGVTTFGVGAGREPPTPSLTANNGLRPSDVVARWIFFAGLLTAGGIAFFRFLVGPASAEALLIAFVLAFIGASGTIAHALLSTRFGMVMAGATVLAAVGAVLAALAPLYRRLEPLPYAAALLLLLAPSLAGHALDAGRPRIEVVVDVFHVAAASLWLGGLVSLFLALRRPVERGQVVRRFSTLALVSVLVLSASGVIRALSELRAVSQLWSTGYGRLLIVKSGLLALLVALGWVNRYRLIPRLAFDGLRRNVLVELTLLAGLVVAVAILTDSRPGRDQLAFARPVRVPPIVGPPPLPPRNAIVQAQEDGPFAVALAASPPSFRVTVMDGNGRGVRRLSVTIGGTTGVVCGPGCYETRLPGTRRVVEVQIGERRLTFRLPARARPAAGLVARATRAFRRRRSVTYVESLKSSPTAGVVADFTLERPDRLEYNVRGGASGILIGPRRWDRPRGGTWSSFPQLPTPQPTPIWAGRITNAYLLETRPQTYVVSFLSPRSPAWFTVVLDRRTLLPRRLQMTAAAHFMHHRYTAYDAAPRIRPPQ